MLASSRINPAHTHIVPQRSVFPPWWRLVLIGLATLILTACNSLAPRGDRSPALSQSGAGPQYPAPGLNPALAQAGGPSGQMISGPMRSSALATSPRGKVIQASAQLPMESYGGPAENGPPADGMLYGGYQAGLPQPIAGCASCDLQGPACGACSACEAQYAYPHPADEYVCDGGDQGVRVRVASDFHIDGLDPEDTVAHYDTLDGQTVVEPTNRVCVYSPRFAAVRKVGPVILSEQYTQLAGAHNPTPPVDQDTVDMANTTLQQLPALGDIGTKKVTLLREREPVAALINELSPRAFQNRYKAYENYEVIRTGIAQQDEKAYLAQKYLAAIVWSKEVGPQVTIENLHAQLVTKDQSAQLTYTVDLPGNPKLRVFKVASTDIAQPGEVIDFTIRYDNTGNQKIGNVTIVDSLTTRLEYVPNSAQSSQKANFSTKVNDADSLVLRWEIVSALEPGDGGVLRFQCRVR